MELDDLVVDMEEVRRGRKITVRIKVSDNGISIKPEDPKEKLSLDELACLSAMAYIYSGFASRGFVMDADDVVESGMEIYGDLKRAIRGDYKIKKTNNIN